eukprot:TRINITY_DN4695_c0_g1_i19.p1 TRINITY_DN4695_c0_g1~~TRINITY_DN4695_c0_g1_i19.p1  ORF type:complete len:639 (-),score=181.52 TRINITY_DN4695_c0_g1_i19:115-2031(-)
MDSAIKVIDTLGALSQTVDPAVSNQVVATGTNLVDEVVGMMKAMLSTLEGEDQMKQLRVLNAQTTMTGNSVLDAVRQGDAVGLESNKSMQSISTTLQELAQHFIFLQAGQVEELQDCTTVVDAEKKLANIIDQLHFSVKDLKDYVSSDIPPAELNKKIEKFTDLVNQSIRHSIDSTTRLREPTIQQAIINTSKEIGEVATQLIGAVRDVHRRPNNATYLSLMASLHEGLDSSLKTSQAIVQDAAETLLKNQNTLTGLQSKVKVLVDTMPILENPYLFTPEGLFQSAKDVVAATAGIVLATTQDSTLKNVEKAHDAMETLIKFTRTAAEQDHIDKSTTDEIGKILKKAAVALSTLVDSCNLAKHDEATKINISTASNTVSSAINQLVTQLKLLPEAKDVVIDEETQEDLTAVAETELQKCARLIEDASKMLTNLKPRTTTGGFVGQDHVNEAILSSARAITSATHKLIVNAEDAQLKRKQTDVENRYNVDPTWANGLISAAQSVAANVGTLVQAANASVEGQTQEAVLVATARAVAQSTAHLVAASKAKSDPFSPEVLALSEVAKVVANATSQLVEAAHNAAKFQEEEEEEQQGLRFTGDRLNNVLIMEQQMKLQRLEVELQKERRALAAMRRAKYQKR